jgi:glc operon protein GlcG
MSETTAALIAVVALSSAAAAQVTEKKALTLEGARKVVATAVATAKSRSTTGVVAVVDDGGNLMALERLDGTFGAGAKISIGKARTAALFKKPSRAFEDVIGKGRTAMVALDDFTPLQGGIPLEIGGQIVGAVGVSGASSAQEDEELALAGAAALTDEPAHASDVSYFDHDAVAQSFAKGTVLFDGRDGYMVHTSRRDGPGQAEVHVRDADVIYVQEGGATFVTGGSVVDPKTVAPEEIRGKEISGGETRRLARGDVVIVPAGTPHWFKEVAAPFTYYVVKAR